MEMNETVQLLEGLLFLAADGISLDDIIGHFELDSSQIETAIDIMKKKYDQSNGINLLQYKNKIQFATNPSIVEQLSEILNPIRERSLTRAALETVAIVAYKQPITRLEIENVRGVNSDYAIDLLQNNNLVEVVGRKDAIGKPLLFGTTDSFLKRFGIQDIKDLPDYDSLLDRIKVINSEGSGLYREFDIDNTKITSDNIENGHVIRNDAETTTD